MPVDKILPITIFRLIAYINLDGSYGFISSSRVAGKNQRVKTETNILLFQAIVGKKLNVINFYCAIGSLNWKK